MKAKTGYALLLIFLILLIAVHIVFLPIFFIMLVVIAAYQAKKSREVKKKKKTRNVDPVQENKPDAENDSKAYPPEQVKSASAISTNSTNDTDDEIAEAEYYDSADHKFGIYHKTDHDMESFSKDALAYNTGHPESAEKTFKKDYWALDWNDSPQYKQHKFLEAIEFCEKNNLGSKSKIRRLRTKIERWGIVNERDEDALLSDYEHLVELIEFFGRKPVDSDQND